jgi:DMSO/TMAO reductase YedYZ molybdopterin-dependent catalytic subunit
MDVRTELPIHTIPDEAARAEATLRVDGLVQRQLVLVKESMAQLTRTTLEEPFTCEEGWTVAGMRWAGVRLADVLAQAEPLPNARFVRVCQGAFVLPLSLPDAELAILCDELNGAPLNLEHGAPWRLVVPGAACYTSVKWVERLELASEPGENSAHAIARTRLARL